MSHTRPGHHYLHWVGDWTNMESSKLNVVLIARGCKIILTSLSGEAVNTSQTKYGVRETSSQNWSSNKKYGGMWGFPPTQSPIRALTSPIYMESEIYLVHRSNKLSCVSILNSATTHVAAASQTKWNRFAACFSFN